MRHASITGNENISRSQRMKRMPTAGELASATTGREAAAQSAVCLFAMWLPARINLHNRRCNSGTNYRGALLNKRFAAAHCGAIMQFARKSKYLVGLTLCWSAVIQVCDSGLKPNDNT